MNEATEKKCWKAIRHTLFQIRDNPAVGWYCGHGTETFELLTEAASALAGVPVKDVKKTYTPKNPKNPAVEKP